MRYYSTTGDSGTTSFGRGSKTSKADASIEFVGALDEAQAALSFAATEADRMGYELAKKNDPSPAESDQSTQLDEVYQHLAWMQQSVFFAGTIVMETAPKELQVSWSWNEHLAEIEEACKLLAPKEPLTSFVLPGGSELAARIELARTAIRRLERVYCRTYDGTGLDALPLFNRLSSLAFVLARRSNEILEVSELTL